MDTGKATKPLTQLASWKALAKHSQDIKATTLRDLFAQAKTAAAPGKTKTKNPKKKKKK